MKRETEDAGWVRLQWDGKAAGTRESLIDSRAVRLFDTMTRQRIENKLGSAASYSTKAEKTSPRFSEAGAPLL